MDLLYVFQECAHSFHKYTKDVSVVFFNVMIMYIFKSER